MTPKQKLALRASAVRKRLAELGALDEVNDEQRAEIGKLSTEYQDIETRSQALTLSEEPEKEDEKDPPTETRETTELGDLERRADVGDLFYSLLNSGRHYGDPGPMRELQQHAHLGDNQIPLSLLTRSYDEDLETRAATQAPSRSSH